MVKRSSRIVSKPSSTATQTPDQWVGEKGLDPEIQLSQIAETSEIPETVKSRTYPHRISFDVEQALYKRLKRVSFEVERPMNDILREAIEGWLNRQNY